MNDVKASPEHRLPEWANTHARRTARLAAASNSLMFAIDSIINQFDFGYDVTVFCPRDEILHTYANDLRAAGVSGVSGVGTPFLC